MLHQGINILLCRCGNRAGQVGFRGSGRISLVFYKKSCWVNLYIMFFRSLIDINWIACDLILDRVISN
jgi:hypothetical protein